MRPISFIIFRTDSSFINFDANILLAAASNFSTISNSANFLPNLLQYSASSFIFLSKRIDSCSTSFFNSFKKVNCSLELFFSARILSEYRWTFERSTSVSLTTLCRTSVVSDNRLIAMIDLNTSANPKYFLVRRWLAIRLISVVIVTKCNIYICFNMLSLNYWAFFTYVRFFIHFGNSRCYNNLKLNFSWLRSKNVFIRERYWKINQLKLK